MSIYGWDETSNSTPLFWGIYGISERVAENSEHDRYEVFVNGDYVGNKVLIAQSEKISDIDDHLKNNGFNNFKDVIIGNKLNIEALDTTEANRIKQNLNVYLKIR